MNTQHDLPIDELYGIIAEKLTALLVEMEEAGWSGAEIAFAIEDVLGGNGSIRRRRCAGLVQQGQKISFQTGMKDSPL